MRFRQLMVEVANESPDEVVRHLERFMTQLGARANIRARARQAVESPDGLGARISATHCEVAAMLAKRLGLSDTVCDALFRGFERWDGRGFPHGSAGEDVPIAVRLAVVARDIEVLTRTVGLEATRDALRRRRDAAYDPRVVDAFLRQDTSILAAIGTGDVWEEVLRREPGEPAWVRPDRLDQALTAFADFADAKTPHTLGHSRAVSRSSPHRGSPGRPCIC